MTSSSEVEAKLELGSVDPLLVFGSRDANLRLIRQFFPVRVVLRNGIVTVLGERSGVDGAKRLLGRMLDKARSGQAVDEADLLQWKAAGGGPGPRAIALDATQVVNANAHAMMVSIEPLEELEARGKEESGGTGVTGVRRL